MKKVLQLCVLGQAELCNITLAQINMQQTNKQPQTGLPENDG